MGLFARLFKKRSSSQPVQTKQSQTPLNKNTSLPNLAGTNDSNNLKSLGQITEPTEEDDDEITTSSLKTKNLDSSRLKTTTGYESSSESSEDKKSRNSLDFLNTLTGTKEAEPDSKSITSVSSHSTIQPKSSLKNSDKSLAERIKDAKLKTTGSDLFRTNSTTNQTVTFREPESEVLDKKKQDHKTNDENKLLKLKIESLEKQAFEREEKFKRENDALIIKLHESLSKGMKNDSERQELIRVLVSKQQESNEKLINEQNKIIDSLMIKSKRLENEVKMLKNLDNVDVLRAQVDHLGEENENLKKFIHRQNVELDFYFKTYGKLKENDLTSKLKDDKQKWKYSINQMSPLFLIYDEKLKEKDDSLRLMRLKINDLTQNYNNLIEENQNLQIKLDRMPDTIKSQLIQIKSHAELVLEENKYLNEKLSMEEQKVYDTEKYKIEEIARLSKRIILCETERLELLNKIDLLESNNQEVIKKYNEVSIEMQRRVKLDEHLTQLGDLKRKMEELNLKHKQEMELLILKIQAFEDDKKNYVIRLTDTETEVKRLKAENQVLDQALNKGIGQKAQKKLQELTRSNELCKLNEKKAFKILEKLEKENEKLKFDKGMIENLYQITETSLKEKDKKIEELLIRTSKMEESYNEYKEKTSLKLANVLEKLKKKESDMTILKMENEKKITKILKSLGKKEHLNNHMTQKDSSETSFDTKKLKEVLLELKS